MISITDMTKDREEFLKRQDPDFSKYVSGLEARLDKILSLVGQMTYEAKSLYGEIAELKARGAMLPDRVYRVGINEDFPSVTARGLKEIGILATESAEMPGTLSLEVIDAILAYSRAGVDTLLEIEPGSNLNPNDLLVLSQNCSFNISLLPPCKERASEEDWSQYAKYLCDFARAFIGVKNADYSVYPVSNFIHYMIMDEFGNPPSEVATDSYVIENFVDALGEEKMDAIKAQLMTAIHEGFGGKEQFSVFCHSLAHATALELESLSNK